MNSQFQKMTSKVFVVVFIGFIIVSFMFSDFSGLGMGGGSQIAKVGDYSIGAKEYEMEINRQMQMYQSFTGGQPLTSQQIELFGIRKSALNSLVQKKLIQQFSNDLDIVSSPEEIKKIIKDLPYFKTNDQFDSTKYKQLLAANRMTPKEFEGNIADDLQAQSAAGLLSLSTVSDSLLKEIIDFKNKKLNTKVLEVSKANLTSFISVNNSEIKAFFESEANLARVQSLYKERSENDKEIPSFELQKNTLATELLQQSKTVERDQLYQQIIVSAQNAFKAKNFKEVKNIATKYSLNYEDNVEFNPYSGLSGQIKLEEQENQDLFKKFEDSVIVETFDHAQDAKIVFAEKASSKSNKSDIESERDLFLRSISNTLRQEVLSKLEEKTKVKVLGNI